MSMGPPPSAVQSVPVGETVATAYRTVFGQLDQLARAAAVPFLFSVFLFALTPMTDSPAVSVLLTLLNLVPHTIFAVAWHRLVLLGAQTAPASVAPAWHRRHWRFYSYALLLALMNAALLLGLQAATGGLALNEAGEISPDQSASFAGAALVGLLLLFYVVMRLSFVFPAVAVDEDYRLGNAWRHTGGQGLRLMLIVFLALTPVLLLGWTVLGVILSALARDGVSTFDSGVAFLATSALGYLSLALSLTVVSTAFRICTGWVAAIPGPPARRPEDEDSGFDEPS